MLGVTPFTCMRWLWLNRWSDHLSIRTLYNVQILRYGYFDAWLRIHNLISQLKASFANPGEIQSKLLSIFSPVTTDVFKCIVNGKRSVGLHEWASIEPFHVCLECRARPRQIPNARWTTFAHMEQKWWSSRGRFLRSWVMLCVLVPFSHETLNTVESTFFTDYRYFHCIYCK